MTRTIFAIATTTYSTFLASLIIVVALTSKVSAADTIWQATGEGHSLEAQFSAEGGGGRINLFQSGDSTYLFYEIWGDDLSSERCTLTFDEFGGPAVVCHFTSSVSHYGWGEIPSSDLKFTANNVRLVTTTGKTYSNTVCTTDKAEDIPVTTCNNKIQDGFAIQASFDLTWKPDDFPTSTTAGVFQHAFRSFVFNSEMTSVARTAQVSGTANGRTLVNAPGRSANITGKHTASVTTP